MAGLRGALTDVNYLIPSIERRLLPRMLAVTAMGALVAGSYGIIHDQITYSISPEYFTRFKFDQFAGADFGFPPRVFVSEIGFLATWWVGLIAGWFFARMAMPAWPPQLASRRIFTGFCIMIGFALAGAFAGGFFGTRPDAGGGWEQWTESFGVEHFGAFVLVGHIHIGSYLGAVAGFAAAMIRLARLKRFSLNSPRRAARPLR